MSERFKFRQGVQLFLVGALAVESLGAMASPNVKRTWQALNAPDPTCNTLAVPIDHFGAIVVFGMDQKGMTSDQHKLDLTTAAARAYSAGYSDTIVIPGNIPGYKQKGIYKELKERIKILSQDQAPISRDNVVFINHAQTFAKSMQNLGDFMSSNNLSDALAISNWYYINRLTLQSQNKGVAMAFTPAECLAGVPIQSDIDTSNTKIGEKLGIIYTAIDNDWVIAGAIKSKIQELKHKNVQK